MSNSPPAVGLATDRYQLTMGASYHALHMAGRATFSLFVRRPTPNRSQLVVAGLAVALDRVQQLRFDAPAIAYLRSLGQIQEVFLDTLVDFRFSGDIWGVPEGRVVFADESILEVQASIIEAQLAETIIVNAIHFPTLVATKAARCVSVAAIRTLIDFGLRRTPSIVAGLAVARAAYLAGFNSTSNVHTGQQYRIPVAGTVAHSFIETFPSEIKAFRAFAEIFPGPVTLLIDTYDAVSGAHHAVEVVRELAAQGRRLAAVRIDSGDLALLSRQVRGVLDDAGLGDVQIVASGELDEIEIAELVRAGAPINAFGVGTQLAPRPTRPPSTWRTGWLNSKGDPV